MSVISSITALIPGGPAYRSVPTASPTGQLPPPGQGSLLHSPLPVTLHQRLAHGSDAYTVAVFTTMWIDAQDSAYTWHLQTGTAPAPGREGCPPHQPDRWADGWQFEESSWGRGVAGAEPGHDSTRASEQLACWSCLVSSCHRARTVSW